VETEDIAGSLSFLEFTVLFPEERFDSVGDMALFIDWVSVHFGRLSASVLQLSAPRFARCVLFFVA
jgi:hypothetical protein